MLSHLPEGAEGDAVRPKAKPRLKKVDGKKNVLVIDYLSLYTLRC